MTLRAPVAKNLDGSSITGRVLSRFSDMPADATTLPILRGGVAGTADPASLDTSRATLTRRTSEQGKLVPLRSADWAFADCTLVPFPGRPDPRKLCLKGGFNPAYLYELVYTAKDPKVYGIGFAATRDLNSYLRYGIQDDTGAANPLRGRIRATVSQGNSQSGNFLRSFIHLGFNQDESGRMVFDGSNPNIAARLLALNFRFAAPSGAAAMYSPAATASSGGRITRTKPGIIRRPDCSTDAGLLKPVQRSWRRSGRLSFTICAPLPAWSALAPTAIFRSRRMSAAITFRA